MVEVALTLGMPFSGRPLMEKKPPVTTRELIEAIATLHVINGLSWKTSPLLNKPIPSSPCRMAQRTIINSF
jgi:hypothetical protein